MPSWGENYDNKVSLAARVAVDVDVTEFARGNPEALIEYWRDGPGAERIAWGTECDFTRCMLLVGKYVSKDVAGGFCQNRHMEIYGESNAAKDKREGRTGGDCSGTVRPE